MSIIENGLRSQNRSLVSTIDSNKKKKSRTSVGEAELSEKSKGQRNKVKSIDKMLNSLKERR